jgi:lysophospholipase L1-like esterase
MAEVKSIATIPPGSKIRMDITNPPIDTLLMGHSFINNLDNDIKRHLKRNKRSSKARVMDCEDINVTPHFNGLSGATMKRFDELIVKPETLNPKIIILEMGSNDLCWESCQPTKLAETMVNKAASLFNVYSNLELIAICHITQKLSISKGDKKVEKFNTQAVVYNEKLTELVRNEIGLIKWTHRGVAHMSDELTNDGTHLNTGEGAYKYFSSLCNAIKSTKREWLLRINETAQQAVNRRNRRKREKEKARRERRKEEWREERRENRRRLRQDRQANRQPECHTDGPIQNREDAYYRRQSPQYEFYNHGYTPYYHNTENNQYRDAYENRQSLRQHQRYQQQRYGYTYSHNYQCYNYHY